MTEIDFRPAREADFAAQRDVFCAAEGGLYERHGFEPPAPPLERFARPMRHLLTVDGERSFVAVRGGSVIGFSAAFARGGTWFLSALFVDPRFQGCGVGSGLLERSWGQGFERRLTITDSIQPISNGLYAQRGLVPATPILTLFGESRRPDAPPDLEPGTADLETVAALDGAAYGFDRRADHGYWSAGAECTVWRRGEQPVAYSYCSADGQLGPIAGRRPDDAAAALAAELARRCGSYAEVTVPGSARRLVACALAAGLRFHAPPGLLLLSDGVEPPTALAISSYWLL